MALYSAFLLQHTRPDLAGADQKRCISDYNRFIQQHDQCIRNLITSNDKNATFGLAYRIMAEAYKSMGEYALCKQAIEKIPETYFSNLYVKADLLDGEEKYEAANKEKNLCLEHMIYMLYILADHYTAQGDTDKAIIQLEIARNVLNSFESDFATQYTRSAYDPEEIENINKRITDLKSKK